MRAGSSTWRRQATPSNNLPAKQCYMQHASAQDVLWVLLMQTETVIQCAVRPLDRRF